MSAEAVHAVATGRVRVVDMLAREVARAPGYLKPEHFLAMFRFVREEGYKHGTFRDFLQSSKG